MVEKEPALFTKASSTNQGQLHMGYMYSADKALANDCAENFFRFSNFFGKACFSCAGARAGIFWRRLWSPE